MSGAQTEAGCVTALSKEPGVSVQAVEARAVLSASCEFNHYCNQPTHVLKKAVHPYKYCFKYLLWFLSRHLL